MSSRRISSKIFRKKIDVFSRYKLVRKNINNVKIIDCSWHMPQANRSGLKNINKEHIPNAIFFDLDKNSKINTDLPHMLTDINHGKKLWKIWALKIKMKL